MVLKSHYISANLNKTYSTQHSICVRLCCCVSALLDYRTQWATFIEKKGGICIHKCFMFTHIRCKVASKNECWNQHDNEFFKSITCHANDCHTGESRLILMYCLFVCVFFLFSFFFFLHGFILLDLMDLSSQAIQRGDYHWILIKRRICIRFVSHKPTHRNAQAFAEISSLICLQQRHFIQNINHQHDIISLFISNANK